MQIYAFLHIYASSCTAQAVLLRGAAFVLVRMRAFIYCLSVCLCLSVPVLRGPISDCVCQTGDFRFRVYLSFFLGGPCFVPTAGCWLERRDGIGLWEVLTVTVLQLHHLVPTIIDIDP